MVKGSIFIVGGVTYDCLTILIKRVSERVNPKK